MAQNTSDKTGEAVPATDGTTGSSTTSVPGPKGDALTKALEENSVAVADDATADEKRQALVDAGITPELEAAKEQAAKDNEARLENPNEPVRREANPAFGGESFGYGG